MDDLNINIHSLMLIIPEYNRIKVQNHEYFIFSDINILKF